MNRAGHLLASREGSQGKRLLLLGHLDTVFEKQSPVQLWERRGDKVRGQGVVDMKGGDVVIVEALRALHALGALDNTTIAVMLTGDEERTGNPTRVSRAPLVDAAKASDIALSFEGSDRDRAGRDAAFTARRASASFMLTVTAMPGHSSGMFAPHAGFGAIYEGARILNAFRETVPEPGLSFSPGMVLGGTVVQYDGANATGTAFGKGNVIPRSFTATSDLRYLDKAQGDRAREKMRAIVAQSLRGTNAKIAFLEAYPPMAETPANVELLGLYSRASVDAGLGPVVSADPTERGAGDVQFAAPHVAALEGLGPRGRGSHTVDEELDLPSLERAAIRAAILIYRLTR
jgi:glutamate carboxypeptidase